MCMFGSASTKFDFEIIDFVKLIIVKSKLKVKRFMFKYIHLKRISTINLSVIINLKSKSKYIIIHFKHL